MQPQRKSLRLSKSTQKQPQSSSQNTMEQDPTSSPSTPPFTPPFTREGILSLNDGSTSLEKARALFNVDLLTFKAKLMQENILVWNEANGLKVRVHADDSNSKLTIAISMGDDEMKCFHVNGTDPFENVIQCMIERGLKLSRGHYKLFYEHGAIESYVSIETDIDWHNAVYYFSATGTPMFLECCIPAAATPAPDV